jgi:hypothetical protein
MVGVVAVAVGVTVVFVIAPVRCSLLVTVVRRSQLRSTHPPSHRPDPFVALHGSTCGDNRRHSLEETTVYCASQATKALLLARVL